MKSQHLIQLIDSLHKEEKRYVSARLSEGTAYTQLYKQIDAGDASQAHGIHAQNLERELLTLLRNYHRRHNLARQLEEREEHVAMLFQRGLFEAAVKLNEDTLLQARSLDLLELECKLLRWQVRLGNAVLPKEKALRLAEQNEADQRRNRLRTFELQELILLDQQLYNYLKHWGPLLLPGQQLPDAAKLLDTLQFEQLGPTAQLYFLRCTGMRQQLEGALAQALDTFSTLCDMLEQPDHFMLQVQPFFVVQAWHLQFGAAFWLQDFDESLAILHKTKGYLLAQKFPDYQHIKMLLIVLDNELDIHYLRQNLEACRPLVQEMERLLHTYNAYIDKDLAPVLYYNIARHAFLVGNFPKANLWINDLYQGHLKFLRPDIFASVLLMRILLCVELNNYDLIEYQVRSLLHSLQKFKPKDSVEHAIVACIRLLIRRKGRLKPADLANIQSQLQQAAEDHSEKTLLIYFDYLGWFAKHLQA